LSEATAKLNGIFSSFGAQLIFLKFPLKRGNGFPKNNKKTKNKTNMKNKRKKYHFLDLFCIICIFKIIS
jgi:hypothetical protein